MPEQKWPDVLWIVRHGQSAGNVAREEAERARVPLIDIATRDMDTPLSPLGEHSVRGRTGTIAVYRLEAGQGPERAWLDSPDSESVC